MQEQGALTSDVNVTTIKYIQRARSALVTLTGGGWSGDIQGMLRPDGQPLIVSVPVPGRDVRMRIWHIDVGRTPLYLLDTNIPQNRPTTGRSPAGSTAAITTCASPCRWRSTTST